jgi:hypothetical protein
MRSRSTDSGISFVGDALFVDALTNDDVVAVDGHVGAGGDAEKTVTSPLFAAFRAFKQKDVGTVVGKTREHRDRRFGVGQDLRADRNDGRCLQQTAEALVRGNVSSIMVNSYSTGKAPFGQTKTETGSLRSLGFRLPDAINIVRTTPLSASRFANPPPPISEVVARLFHDAFVQRRPDARCLVFLYIETSGRSQWGS